MNNNKIFEKVKMKVAISNVKEENVVMSKEKSKIKFLHNYGIKFAMAMTILTFIALPNISSQISYAMQEIPIVGNIVKVITISNYFDKDGNSELDMEIPEIKNSDESQSKSNEIINEEIDKLTKRIIEKFYEEKDSNNYQSIKLDAKVIENSKDWFTLRLEIFEISGSSDIKYKYYHINKKNDNIINLSDLFVNDNYKDIISEEIKRQMISKMKENEEIVYWIDEEFEELNFNMIKDNQNFYFSKNGNIVIVFDKYEVAPGSTGAPEFEISKDIYSKYLKSY